MRFRYGCVPRLAVDRCLWERPAHAPTCSSAGEPQQAAGMSSAGVEMASPTYLTGASSQTLPRVRSYLMVRCHHKKPPLMQEAASSLTHLLQLLLLLLDSLRGALGQRQAGKGAVH